MKKSKIPPEGKLTANVRISVVNYNFVTYRHWRIFDRKLLCLVVDFLLPTGAMGSFTRANLRRCARYFKACVLIPLKNRCVSKIK